MSPPAAESAEADFHTWSQPLVLSRETVGQLIHGLCSTYKGLALNSEEQFLATPITRLPTGRERGEFLSIDLGGSNLRVAFVELLGQEQQSRGASLDAYNERISKTNDRSWPIGETLKNERAEDLFAWMGDCLAEVIRARYKDAYPADVPEEIPLGITFSFPMIQNALSEATLMPMGKGFSITSNPDLGSMVLAGYARHTKQSTARDGRTLRPLPPIRIAAISNDSVATMLSLRYATEARTRSKAVLGLILGTGTNAAVAMRPEALHPKKVAFATRRDSHSGRESGGFNEIVVNTEWTLRGVGPVLDKLGIITRWDKILDAALPKPGFQPFEYLTAGSYLGELVRLIVYDYFSGKAGMPTELIPEMLKNPNAITTSWLGWNVATEGMDAKTLYVSLVGKSAVELGADYDFWTPDRAAVLLHAEHLVLNRSKTLIAAAIVALLACIDELSLKPPSESEKESSPLISEMEQISWDLRKVSSDPTASVANRPVVNKELVIAYCGGLVCIYQGYLRGLQKDLDFMLQDFVAEKDRTIVLQEAAEGGVIGAGVLAGTVWPLSTSQTARTKTKFHNTAEYLDSGGRPLV